ncbi:MAG TPA: uroporphyrinogen-III synthase [Candidatus Baltobacteraceae bacterium]|nr:uroporphyrinogen-III synthase [Candidatus Baltobacteraceae bacterium]
MTEQSKLAGLHVLSFESRRAGEMAKLIAAYGGKGTVAPSMREVPLESNTEAIAFARTLAGGGFDMAIFLTGVGVRALARVVQTIYSVEQFAEALRRIPIVARGPKPVAALKEIGVPVTLAVPEPNTWHDLLRAVDDKSASLPLAGRRVAVQEYGVSNPELLAALAERGAQLTRVPVYQWALPEDTGPLRAAVHAIVDGQADIVLFTTSVQIVHLLQISREMNLEPQLRASLARIVVGSIGPVTSEELREQGITPDFEPVHPKMGFLLNEAGVRGRSLLEEKRRLASG